MNLDRNVIPAPKNVFDILAKMRDGAFDIDYEEIRKVANKPNYKQSLNDHFPDLPCEWTSPDQV